MRKPEEIATAFSPTESLGEAQRYFLVGIGGAGMSGLARMLRDRGFSVAGTDSTASDETRRLAELGIDVHIGHAGTWLREGDAVILTDAIELATSPEVAAARSLGLPLLRRSQLLGWLLCDYKVLAVTGTHGKTTTTAMLGAGLIAAGMDPLVVVGASIPQWGGPIREGKGKYAVVEACEAYDSFHDLDPYVVVLTNLELDHVDFHGTYARLRGSVVRFVQKIPEDGWLVFCSEDRGAAEVAELSDVRAIPYGASREWQTQIVNKIGGVSGELPDFPDTNDLVLPGRHNLLNAAGALTAAAVVRADLEKVEQALREFKGAERRLQVLREGRVTVVDDYAHHPSEIQASLLALRDRYFRLGSNYRRLIVVFQPHLYSRTAPLIEEFADALSLADQVILTDIYPAREAPMPGVSSARIAERVVKPVLYVPSRHLLPRLVAEEVGEGDVVVGMGAGNIAEFAPGLVREIDRIENLEAGMRPLHVAVVYGGESAEREVSLHSGAAVRDALLSLGHRVTMADVTEMLFSGQGLGLFLGPDRPDLAFLAGHGTGAEDGAIQGVLETLHVPYTGSGIQASAICMDKDATKKVLEREGIRVPRGVLLGSPDDAFDLPLPLIVKPNAQGSTVGLTFIEKPADLCDGIRSAFQYDTAVLVEEWVKGIEISTPVIDGESLEPVEIVPDSGRYDFASKYLPGATREIIPARLPIEVLTQARAIAVKCFKLLRCRGAARVDAIVRGDEIFILEVNTLPGMTKTSLLPNSAAASGISFPTLCDRLVRSALKGHAKEQLPL